MPRGYKHTPDSFWAMAQRTGPCLEWQGQRNRRGYGRLSYQGREWAAHRLAWTLTRGAIPSGLDVCHTCDNPPCIEPMHLFAGTRKDNMRDAQLKGRYAMMYGEANHDAKLTEVQVREIRAAAAQGVSHRMLGRRFGVTHQTITKIVNRRKWPHLT